MTDEELQAQFGFMRENFARMNEGFALMHENFARIAENFVRVDERFAQIDRRFEQVDRRFEQVDRNIADVRRELGAFAEYVEDRFGFIGEAFAHTHEKMDRGFAQIRAEMREESAETRMMIEARVAGLEKKR